MWDFFVPLQPYYIGKTDKYTKIRVGKTDELITYMLNKYIDKLIKYHFQIIHMTMFLDHHITENAVIYHPDLP